MKKIDIAIAVIFTAVVAAFLFASINGIGFSHAEPVSKAEIETGPALAVPAPRAEIKTEAFTVLTQTLSEPSQTISEPQAEEVIASEEEAADEPAAAFEEEQPESGPADIPEEDSYAETVSQDEEVYAEPEPAIEAETAEQSLTYLGEFRITHYCPNSCCCGSWAGGPTASGAMPTAGWTIACGEDIPFGTILVINGHEYCCEDRGVPSGCVDIFVDTHDEAEALGLYYTDVYLVG